VAIAEDLWRHPNEALALALRLGLGYCLDKVLVVFLVGLSDHRSNSSKAVVLKQSWMIHCWKRETNKMNTAYSAVPMSFPALPYHIYPLFSSFSFFLRGKV